MYGFQSFCEGQRTTFRIRFSPSALSSEIQTQVHGTVCRCPDSLASVIFPWPHSLGYTFSSLVTICLILCLYQFLDFTYEREWAAPVFLSLTILCFNINRDIFFSHPVLEGCLCWHHGSAAAESTAVTIGMQVSLGCRIRSRRTRWRGSFIFRKSHPDFHSAGTDFASYPAGFKALFFPNFSAASVFCFLDDSHFEWSEMESQSGFDLHFPDR